MVNAKESSKTKANQLVWTNSEVKLLLRVTLDYKSNKLQEGVDWESCKWKYEDIKGLFEAQYPNKSTEKDFPHDVKTISRIQVQTKLKNIRKNYRKAVVAGRRSGSRVVLKYFELCEQLWGGSPATQCIDAAIETSDQESIEDLEYSSSESAETADSEPTEAIQNLSPAVVKKRRDLLQAKLNNHRGDRLKRKVPATPLEQEDLQIKRRMEEKNPGTFSVQTRSSRRLISADSVSSLRPCPHAVTLLQTTEGNGEGDMEHANKVCKLYTNSAEEDDNNKKMANANAKESSKTKIDLLVWTDNEVKLLLQVTLDYKSNKIQEGVDWESCKSKYEDIKGLFEAQYPNNSTGGDFPHDAKTMSRIQVTTKLKNIKRNYRKAVDTGCRSGNGRVVLMNFELCEQLWGGSPATQCMDAAIETGDLEGIEDLEVSSPETAETADSEPTEAIRNLSPAVVKKRRDLLQAKLNNHRGDRLKRKVPATPLEQSHKVAEMKISKGSSRTNSAVEENNNNKKIANAEESSKTQIDSLVWTDDEVKLLLQVTLDYKSNKIQEGVEWESCKSKYEDIKGLFEAQYPKNSTEKDFPHDAKTISRVQVTSKLKNVKMNYRKAVDAGRRSGNGRVVLIYFELCEQLWGGSPATQCIDAAIETSDQEGIEDLEYSSSESEETADSEPTEAIRNFPPAVVKKRRDLLQAKLNNHRGDRLKRKVPATPLEQEDLQIKRRMLALMEENSRRNSDNIAQINTNIGQITSTIQDGISLMRELLLQPNASNFAHPHSSSVGNGQFQGHPPAFMHTTPHPSTPAFRHTPRPQQANTHNHMPPQYPPTHAAPQQSFSYG